MPAILEPAIESYLSSLLPARDSNLHEMESMALARSFPIMGPLVGRFLYQLVKMTGARRIFELGSGFGYSAYWMAMALADGKIICTELSNKNISNGKPFFDKGDLSDRVEFRCGDALELIQKSEGEFDLIVNDIDKERYLDALDVISPRLKAGGVLVSDNLLWHGRVASPDPDSTTRIIMEYSRKLFNSGEYWTTILPIRDGVGVSYKL